MREIKLFVSDFGMTLPLFLISIREMFKLISWFVILLFVLELFLIFSSESIFLFSLFFSACLFFGFNSYLMLNSVFKRQSLAYGLRNRLSQPDGKMLQNSKTTKLELLGKGSKKLKIYHFDKELI